MDEPVYQPTDRRPIAIRQWELSRRLADRLVRWQVSANAISVAGMLCALTAGLALSATSRWPEAERWLWLAGAILVQARLLANMLDGMVAIQSRRASPVGELYNEVPDRLSDAAVLIGLGYASGGSLVAGYVAACVALFVAYVRAAAKVAGAPQDFCGPMAKPHRMFLVTVGALSQGLIPFNSQPGWFREAPGLSQILLWIISAGGLVTVVLRLSRAARYLYHKQ